MLNDSEFTPDDTRLAILYVDDRPCALTDKLLTRSDVTIVLLRFSDALTALTPYHFKKTQHYPCFVVDTLQSIEDEAARFQRWARKSKLVLTAFLNPSEPRQEISHRFARLLGLPALNESQVTMLRNKIAMKDLFHRLGFRTATYSPVGSIGDVATFACRHKWSVVVKPQDGFACIDTWKINSPDDLALINLRPDRNWMVESFLPGREWEVCALIQDGQVLDAYLSYFPAPPLAATDGEINANISVRRLPLDFPVEPQSVAQRIVDGLGLDHGYMHLELFTAPVSDWQMGEVALRLAGCEIPANHGYAYGFDILGTLIDIHLGRKVELHYTCDRAVGDLLLPVKAGLVVSITPLSDLLAMDGVIGGALKLRPGYTVEPQRASHTSSGYVHVEGADYMEVERRMRRVLEHFHIETELVPMNME